MIYVVQPSESTEELVAAVADLKPGGGGQEGVGQLLQGGGAGGADVWGGDGGTYTKDRAGPGEIPARIRAPDHWKTTAEKGIQAMYIPSSEGVHARGRVQRNSEGHKKEVKCCRATHCNVTNYGPL